MAERSRCLLAMPEADVSDTISQVLRDFVLLTPAIHIQKEGQQAMNRDKGSYQLRHTHTTAFLTRRLPVVSRTGRTEYQLLLMKASDRGRYFKF